MKRVSFPLTDPPQSVGYPYVYGAPCRHNRSNKPYQQPAVMSMYIVVVATLNTGKAGDIISANFFAAGNVAAMPTAQPIMAIINDSPKIMTARCFPPKPSVLSTAYSPSRSRAFMAIVLAITAMIIIMTTKDTIRMATMMASDIDTNPSWKAFSVSVNVSASEFLN